MLKQIVVVFVAVLMSFGATAAWSDTAAPATPKMRIAAHADIECETCHASVADADLPSNKVCLSCHAPYEKLVQATSGYALNPHDSPHWGKNVPCGVCHLQHQEPKVLCASCHTYEPYKAR